MPTARIDDCLSIRDGRLFVEDCDAVDLAQRHGTPLSLVSEAQLRRNARRITSAFRAHWPEGPVGVLPSIKANLSKRLSLVVRLIECLGLRVGSEALSLTYEDVDFAAGRIRVSRARTKGRRTSSSGQTVTSPE